VVKFRVRVVRPSGNDKSSTLAEKGWELWYKGKKDKAADAFKEALRHDPNCLLAHSGLASVYIDTDKLDEALKELHQASEIDPRNASVRNRLGWVYVGLGNSYLSIREFEEAVRLDPNNAEYRANLAKGRDLADGRITPFSGTAGVITPTRTVKEINIRCGGCGREYTLGKDAIVVSASATMSQFRVVSLVGNSTMKNTQDTPDLIDSLQQRSWSSLDEAAIGQQQTEISRISSSLLAGTPQWWRCRICSAVQVYR
jgi:Flp pilus assembly protein TadD